jgi:hypothetical protein
MGSFLDEIFSDSKKAFKRRVSVSSISIRRMSVSSSSMPARRKSPPALEISPPGKLYHYNVWHVTEFIIDFDPLAFKVLTYATGIYSNSSPDRSSLLVELPSPILSQDQSSFSQDSCTSPVSRVPRHSCPDIRLYHNERDFVTKDKEYRAKKMKEFESLIEGSKVIKLSLTPECASP